MGRKINTSENYCCNHCEHCLPIGEGDHICDAYEIPALIIDNYVPNENFNKCEGELWEEA
jgi:hypothetical protein